MIHIKTPKEIEIMATGGKMLSETLSAVMEAARPGVSEKALDQLAEKLIREKGGEPGFMKVQGYKHTVCMSTNDVVVHGIPTEYLLQSGDVVGIDCGVFYKGFHTDMSESKIIGERVKGKGESDPKELFLLTGKRALEEAIKMAVVGNHVGDISRTIQTIVEGAGYSVVRGLVGHGVGKKLHEEPEVPGFLSGSIAKTPVLKEGMVIAIEIIYNMGGKDVVYSNQDGWTIRTADKSLSGLFERTVAITKKGPRILT
jgi:methionyl aminopeptidase